MESIARRIAEVVVLREIGCTSCGSVDVVIVAFVMPLDVLEFRDLGWVSGDLGGHANCCVKAVAKTLDTMPRPVHEL